jgi:hypothetical protein
VTINIDLQRGHNNAAPFLILLTGCRDLCPHCGQVTVVSEVELKRFTALSKNDIDLTR